MVSLKAFVFYAWVTFGLGALVYAVLATEYNRMIIFEEPILNKTLPGHVIRTEKVADEGSCRLKCYLEPNCVSINVGPEEEGKHTCELNNATDESPSQSALEDRQGYTHTAVENFYHGNPCSSVKNTICQVGFTNKGFRYVCRQGYTGSQCEVPLQCPSLSWTAYEGSCYKIAQRETWHNADVACKKMNSSLVKIESAEENEFIKSKYLTEESGHYWIGLSDSVDEGNWKWSDGTELTGYTNWARGQPNDWNNNQDCVEIRKGRHADNNDYDGEWQDRACSVNQGYICELRLS